jgi:polyphosphate glucokinase
MNDTSSPTIVGVDIGGSGIKGAPVNVHAGEFAAARVRIPTPIPATPDDVAKTVTDVLSQLDVPGPVGITLPAVVRHGVVETASNIDQSWIGMNANSFFAEATGRPVTVMNDADAAGVAEMTFGVGKDRKGVVLVITLGTGIGSALFVDGKLVPNSELGHLPMHHGVAEDFSAESIRVRDDLSWKKWAQRLTEYVEVLERLLWPELIIVGGGVSKKADKFVPHIEVATEVVAAQLQNDAGIIGAALGAVNP